MILKILQQATERDWQDQNSASWSEAVTLTLTSGHILKVNSYTTQGYEEEKDVSRLSIDFGNGAVFSQERNTRSIVWTLPMIEVIIQDFEGRT